MARGSTSKTLVWILMGMLILGLGGFGITGLSGTIRTVGSVGDQEIDINAYARAMQEELRAVEAQTGQKIDFAQAQAMGIDRAVLARLIGQAALDHETSQLGISVGDANLVKQVTDIAAFKGPDGTFDREAYAFALRQAGMTEAEFETSLRADTARTLLQGAIVSGVAMPDTYVDTLITYIAARRSFSYIRLDQSALDGPLPVPTNEQLTAYYQDHTAEFTDPAKKRITYAELTPAMILDQVEVDEASLKALYEERAGELNSPERRLVERLGFADEAAAEAAKIAIERGEKTFEALVEDRGLALSDVDLGDVAKPELGDAADAVFAADTGAVVGPFPTSIGPALFRVNGVLAAQETAYEDALPELRDELAADRARRQIEARAQDLDDMLAGGATLEELTKETEMRLGSIDWFDGSGEDIAGYTAFRDAAASVQIGVYPKIITLDDGGVVALRMDEAIDARILPIDDVMDRVIAGWETDETQTRLRNKAQAMVARLSEGAAFDGMGQEVTTETGATRNQSVLGTPADFMSRIFDMEKGDLTMIDSFGAVLIVRLDDMLPPDEANPAVTDLRESLVEQASGGVAQDLYSGFAADIQSRAGIQLDQRALNAVHANFN